MEIISRKIIKPNQCVIGFGIPTSKQNFKEDQHKSNKDFARSDMFLGIWNKYHHQFITHLDYVEPVIEKLGVTVLHNLSLSDYRNLFLNKKYDVITLFSHWKGSSVEFYDGLVDIHTIVEQIPDEFAGIIDLCVCHPNKLSMLIRELKPNCLVRFIPSEATPSFWLYFYLALFKYLDAKNISYLTALEEIIAEFLKLNKNEKD